MERIPDSFDDPRFPKVVGRTRLEGKIKPAWEIAEITAPDGRTTMDPVTLKSVTSQDWGG